MPFKMILEGAKDDERPIARGLLKHIVVGLGAGLAFGSLVLISLFVTFARLDLHVPVIFMGAALLQFGPIGGLIGAGIYLSRIAERAAPEECDEDDPGTGGGTEAAVSHGPVPAKRPSGLSPAPSTA